MLVKHRGAKPLIHASASVSPSALISGNVTIGPDTAVLAGATITSEGAPVVIGERCIIMEHAVVRGAGKHPCTIGDHVLIGPHAHVCGATVAPRCFLATGAVVFNGGDLGEGTLLAVHSVVHIDTRCLPSTFIPVGHIAYGDPARIYTPSEALALHREIAAKGFTKTVFGLDSSEMSIPESVQALCDRYLEALLKHRDDEYGE
jgi:carbonic anhydrase/acetyltransferase-like protein (isoleucine patch superfamily)